MAEFPYRMQCEDMLSGIFYTQLFFLHTGEKGDIRIRGHSYNENLLQGVSGGAEVPIKMGIYRCAIFGTEINHVCSDQKYLRSLLNSV